jgi:hypothetical protein
MKEAFISKTMNFASWFARKIICPHENRTGFIKAKK